MDKWHFRSEEKIRILGWTVPLKLNQFSNECDKSSFINSFSYMFVLLHDMTQLICYTHHYMFAPDTFVTTGVTALTYGSDPLPDREIKSGVSASHARWLSASCLQYWAWGGGSRPLRELSQHSQRSHIWSHTHYPRLSHMAHLHRDSQRHVKANR